MIQPFPNSDKQYFQNNRTNIYPVGGLWSTQNMDFQSNLGVARVSPRLKLNTGSLNNCPVAIVRFGQRIYALAGTTIYRNTNSSGLPSDAFVADSSTSNSTDYSSDASDMISAWNIMFATAPTRLRKLDSSDGGTWTNVANISSGLNHKLVYFKKFNRVYFSDQSIKSVDEAGSVATTGDYTLSGSNTFGIVDMKTTSQWIWIAVKTEAVSDWMGGIQQWDGISAQITDFFKLPGSRATVCIVIDPTRDIPFAFSDKGILYQFNSGGFSEVGRLPWTFNTLPYMGDTPYTSQINNRYIHPNGAIFTPYNTIRCLINCVNSDSSSTQNENAQSGIWEWSESSGFVHIGQPSYDPISTSVTDWGQSRLSRVGALADMNVQSVAAGRDGTMLAGATYYTNASSTASALFYDNSNDTIQKKGYMVWDWIESSQMADSFDKWWMSYRRFLTASDSITLKYRNVEVAPVEGTITWTSTTTFTVLNSAVVVSDYWTSGTGGEVEILRGTGGALCAHITNAVNNAGTWTVTIDETATGVTNGTATARFQKWTKAYPAVSMATPLNWAQFGIETDSNPRIQIKICFTYTGAGENYKGVLTSNDDIKVTK